MCADVYANNTNLQKVYWLNVYFSISNFCTSVIRLLVKFCVTTFRKSFLCVRYRSREDASWNGYRSVRLPRLFRQEILFRHYNCVLKFRKASSPCPTCSQWIIWHSSLLSLIFPHLPFEILSFPCILTTNPILHPCLWINTSTWNEEDYIICILQQILLRLFS